MNNSCPDEAEIVEVSQSKDLARITDAMLRSCCLEPRLKKAYYAALREKQLRTERA